jgi:parallel beta-helix repeat protein
MVSLILAVPGDVGANSAHDPILITGNQEFTAANGVIGGSGTAEDPFVIAGWQINPTVDPGIHIIRTTAHFVIRDVVIQGTSIWADGPMGVVVEHASNFEIDAVDVSYCGAGIISYKTVDSVIEGCNVHDNGFGIYLSYSRNVEIDGNTASSNMFPGISVESSENCDVINNVINGRGIGISYSRWITASGNIMTYGGVGISGRSLPEFDSHTIPPDNLVNGLPVYYYAGVQGLRLEGIQAGGIILAGCQDVELVGLTIADASGIEIAFSSFVSMDSCILQNNGHGVMIWGSKLTDIRNCLFTGNRDGIWMLYSALVSVSECQFSGNTASGISMFRSDGIFIGESTFSANFKALDFQECSRVTISGNLITASSYGINLDSCSKIWILGNEISYSTMDGFGVGINMGDSTKVDVIQNNFIGNEHQAFVYNAGEVSWDDGVSIGNYWDDYTGTDANNDLIGDTPYVIYGDDQDNFPHMVPFT